MPGTSTGRFAQKFIRPLLAIAASLMFALAVPAQEQVFDYHLQETPAVSWNRPSFFDARAAAAGGISLMASPVFAAAFNPALIPDGAPRLGAGFAGLQFQAFQFWGVNQGVTRMESPRTDTVILPAGLAGTMNAGKWRMAAGYRLSGVLRFPDFAQRTTYEYDQYWEYRGSFSGQERTLYAAAAWRPSAFMALGFRLDFVWGKRRIETTSLDSSYYNVGGQWILKEIAVSHRENNLSSIWIPSVGVCWRPHQGWTLAAAFAYPLTGRVQRSLEQSFENPYDGVHISILRECRDLQKKPASLLCSVLYDLKLNRRSGTEKKLSLAAEAKASFWSSYRYEYFAETMPRDLRDTMETALGLEYAAASSTRSFFIRLGVRRDPQPPRLAKTTLWAWSGGVGARLGRLSGDVGLVLYSGTTIGIRQRHWLCAASIAYEFKGE
jgi:hypothetical protein